MTEAASSWGIGCASIAHEVPMRLAPPAQAELVVIGGGMVGASTAFLAAPGAGVQPLLLEGQQAVCTHTTAATIAGYRLQLEHREELDLVRRT